MRQEAERGYSTAFKHRVGADAVSVSHFKVAMHTIQRMHVRKPRHHLQQRARGSAA